jgi:hypothetical protein
MALLDHWLIVFLHDSFLQTLVFFVGDDALTVRFFQVHELLAHGAGAFVLDPGGVAATGVDGENEQSDAKKGPKAEERGFMIRIQSTES